MSVKSSYRSEDDELDRLVGFGIARQQVESGDGCLDCLDPEVLASYADGGLTDAERAVVESHLANCRDCRRALALLMESDPTATATTFPTIAPVTDASTPAVGSSRASSGSRFVNSAKIWLPLAAALVVATGLWFALDRPHRISPAGGSAAPASISARNEPSPAPQEPLQDKAKAAPPAELGAARQAAPSTGLEERAAPPAAPPQSEAAPPPASSAASPTGGGAAPSASVAAAPPPAPADRAREARRDGFAGFARPDAEADQRARPADAARAPAPAAVPPPAPPPAPAAPATTSADAFRAGAPGREAQATGTGQAAGQLAGQALPAPATPAAAPQQAPALRAEANQANQAGQASQANQAPAVNAQQQAVNQQTGPMSNLNITSPPPAKPDDRRQADAKRETAKSAANANETSAAPSSANSTDGALAKAADAPKPVARAKTAPEAAAAAAPAAPAATQAREGSAPSGGAASAAGANAASGAGGKASGTVPEATAARGVAPSDSTIAGGAATGRAASGTDDAARARAVDSAGARANDTSTREINETVTITSAAAASPVLRSADGARWWRIRMPGTIEGSGDRGTTWTVEYSEPSSVLVRGAAGAKSGCWMIGDNGLVLRIRPNGGWERVKQPTGEALVRVTATDHLIASVTDNRGRTYRTTDGGATWR